MSEASIFECEDCIEPAEAFSVVGNETRLAILEALWKADATTVTFSDLRKDVGMRDSAQFNYHLDKLVGQFVRKTDEGYELRHAGRAIIRAVRSGTVHEDPKIDPFPVDGDCPACDGDLRAGYGNETLTVECTDCEAMLANYSFPPGGLDGRTREEVVKAFDQRVRHLHCLAADGVCHECNGRMETTFVDGCDRERLDLDLCVRHECRRCGHAITTSVGMVLLDHADVVTFYGEHGVDLNDRYFWTLPWCIEDGHTTVLSEDPWKVELTIPLDDERLVLTVDEDLQVRESEREPSDCGPGTRGAV